MKDIKINFIEGIIEDIQKHVYNMEAQLNRIEDKLDKAKPFVAGPSMISQPDTGPDLNALYKMIEDAIVRETERKNNAK